MTHVPYRGAGPAVNDLIPGRVDAMFSNLPGVLPQVQERDNSRLGRNHRQALTRRAGHTGNRRNTARI